MFQSKDNNNSPGCELQHSNIIYSRKTPDNVIAAFVTPIPTLCHYVILLPDLMQRKVRSPGTQFQARKLSTSITTSALILLLIIFLTLYLIKGLLYKVYFSCLKFNMKISIHKMEAMTMSKEPIRCKLEIDDRMVEQVMEFNYWGVNITSSGNLVKKIKVQGQKQQQRLVI